MKTFLLPALIFIGGILNAQTLILRDKSTREPVSDAIVSDKSGKSVVSDNRGMAVISDLDKSDSLAIYHFAYFSLMVKAGGEEKTEILLTAKMVKLDEVVFSVNRTREKKIDVPYQVEILSAKEIEFGNQPTTGDVLANTGNVMLQKSQAGGGSPNLRGFEASRVLLVVDGIRMNNAIYRSGHLQDVMTVDAQMLERVEVIFGPSSTIYGSDALGGVMHFYTKNAQFSTDEKMLLKQNTMLRYASVNNETTAHLDFNTGWRNFASLTNVTWSRFGDTRTGRTRLAGYSDRWERTHYVERVERMRNTGTAQNPVLAGTGVMIDSMIPNKDKNVLVGSGYEQLDFMQRFSLRTGDFMKHHINFQLSSNPNLPRFDRLANDYSGGKLKFAENYYAQNRLLGAYTLDFSRPAVICDNIRLIAAYQKIDQDRTTRNFGSANRITQMEDVMVISANLDFSKKIRQRHELRYGAEATSNDVKSSAKTTDIVKDSTFRANTRYAPANTMNTCAAYISESFEVNRNFVISGGLRFSAVDLKCHFRDTLPFKFPFVTAAQRSRAITGSIGFTWKKESNYKFSLLANTGFRSPNVDDMSKLFDSKAVLIVANPEINPEYASNFEIGLTKVIRKKFEVEVSAYYTLVENYLTLQDFKFQGMDSVEYNGSKLKVQAMQNSDRAYIYGFNAGCEFDFNENLSLRSTVNYIYGRYTDVKKDTVYPLDHIPPVYGQSSVIFKGKNTEAEFFVRYTGKKNLADYSPSGEDNLPYATPDGTPAWYTLNLRAGYNITKNFRINAACENITDNGYRMFASGINAPGRNFMVSLRYKL